MGGNDFTTCIRVARRLSDNDIAPVDVAIFFLFFFYFISFKGDARLIYSLVADYWLSLPVGISRTFEDIYRWNVESRSYRIS